MYRLEQGLSAYNENGDEAGSVELLTRCGRCSGEGVIVNKQERSVVDCQACGGQGVRLGWDGQKLLRFVRDWAGHPDIDKEINW